MSILPLYIDDSERFSRRDNDKTHWHRFKGGERILEGYQSNPINILKMVHDDHILFHVGSESSSDTWYDVSLSTHYYNCLDRVSTCKYILDVQKKI
jgi:hypothetical protein